MSALKPATSIDQQIEILRERGMSVDEPLARQWLASVSYYRVNTQNVCIFRACRGGLVSCPAFADV